MIFSDRPIEDPKDLYDREKELEELKKACINRAITLVLGTRRTGKTSLIKVATRDMNKIYIDIRKFEEENYITYKDFMEDFKKSLNQFTNGKERLLKLLKNIRGVSILGNSITFKWKEEEPSFSSILESLNNWAEEENTHLVIVMDEIQELTKMRGRNLLQSFAYSYDNLKHISFIFAGSKIGMLYNYLKIDNENSPLYGRYMEKIELKPLTKDQSIDFLLKGFKEAGINVDIKLLEKAADELGGIIGWLSLFGLISLKNPSEKALDETINIASKIVIKEFCNFVRTMNSNRYTLIINALKFGARWSEIKKYLELKEGKTIHDSELTKLLKNLQKNGFIQKEGETYIISDPILRKISNKINCTQQLKIRITEEANEED